VDSLTARQRVTQGLPPESLQGFPIRRYQNEFYRAARESPWWFCTCGDCRFDIQGEHHSGLGTLYAGSDPITGVVEIIGPEMIERPISRAFLAERMIWTLSYDRALVLADLIQETALGFGVTNELSTMVPYDVPQAWAEAFADENLDGISYRTRFSTGKQTTGIALFDEAGAHDWVALPYCRADDEEIVATLKNRLIDVEDIPLSSSMDVIN